MNERSAPLAGTPRRLAPCAAALAAALGFALTGCTASAAQTAADPPAQAAMPSLAPIVNEVMPAVVNVSVVMKPGAPDEGDNADGGQAQPDQPTPDTPGTPFDELLRRFFEQHGMPGAPTPPPQIGKRVALGSGFVIDPKGYIVTNGHVVGNAETVTVVFRDNSRHKAKIVGRDEKTDLALLKIDTDKPLPYVKWGDSDRAQVGDWVIAVGNPFGLGGTVTTGIISALGRDIHEGPFDDFLQLDAAINRGNSGGPTFNMQGQVIGINTAIYSPNGGSVGIGFAIPSNLARKIVAQLEQHGRVTRGWLGVQIQEVTPSIAKSLGLDHPAGALVASVQPNSPAARAGVRQGDVILKFAGKDVGSVRDLPRLVAEAPIGQEAPMTVYRDGKRETLTPKIAEMPAEQHVASAGNGSAQQQQAAPATALGLKLAPLNDRMRQRLHLGKNVEGVVVAGVADGSPAAELGIEPGDVIESIDRRPVSSPEDAVNRLRAATQGNGSKNVLLLLNRHGINEFVGLSTDTAAPG